MSGVDAVAVAAVLGSGVVAGVLFAVALSVLPALSAMSPQRYVYTHQMLGRRWDPTMPIIVLGSLVIDLVLAALAPTPPVRGLFLAAAVLLLGVSVVSHFGNVPINRRIKNLDPERVPVGWRDPRPLWWRWHLVRTVLAVLALTVNAAALTML